MMKIWPWSEIAALKAQSEAKSAQMDAMTNKIMDLSFHLWQHDPKLVRSMGIYIQQVESDAPQSKGLDS
jgi:hypothetical protein